MNFSEFKYKYIKKPVIEYPNNREGKIPLVTVKVVTYNHANFIKECLDSVLMQKTNFDFEILIAEDDSNDGTRSICIEYAKKYPNTIRLLLNSRENNIYLKGKPTGNFNSIYANFCIQSKYINLVEGDDCWTDKNSLQKRVDFLEKSVDFTLCYHNSKVFIESEKRFNKNKMVNYTKDKIIKPENIITSGIPTSTLLYRNGLVEIFDEGMLNSINGDLILKSKLSQFGKGMFMSTISDAIYRIHEGGVYGGATMSFQTENSINTNEYLKEYFVRKGWDLKIIYNSFFVCYFNSFIFKLLLKREFDTDFLKKSFKYSKLSKRSFFLQLFLFSYTQFKRKLL